MARRVKGETGTAGVVLPGGWVLDAGDEVVVPDAEWDEIRDSDELFTRVRDMGHTSDLPTPVPTFRDIQRAVAGGATGLEGEIDSVNDALVAHIADTSVVHGIDDTGKLAWLQQVVSPSGAAVGNVLTKTAAGAYAFTPSSAAVVLWEQVYNFAVATDDWVINHGQGTKAVHVEIFDNSDNPLDGNVLFPDNNTIRVQYYYPQSGYARVWTLT